MQQPLSLFSRLEERDLIAEWGDTYVIHFSGSLRQHAYCIYKIIKKKKNGEKVLQKSVWSVWQPGLYLALHHSLQLPEANRSSFQTTGSRG